MMLVLGLYAAYSLTQGSLGHKELVAFQNSYNIIDLEKHLRIFWELNIQAWFLNNFYLTHLANELYTYLFYPVIITFAIWAYNRHHQEYKKARNVFLVSSAIGLICFAFFPMAPPRMIHAVGFVDTLAKFEAINYDSSIPPMLVNQFAAMPSFHFGWTLLVGIATFQIARSWWLKTL
jgi:hypothetical protein